MLDHETVHAGVTSNTYDDNAIKYITKRFEFNSIAIVNTDSAESLKFKIIGYTDKLENISTILKSETTLASKDSYRLNLNQNIYDHVIVYVKNNVSNVNATYVSAHKRR